MLSQETREELARKGNELLLAEYARFLHGYPEAERILHMKLSDEYKFSLLVSAFTAILNKLKEYDPEILSDPFTHLFLTSASRIPAVLYAPWVLALTKAEDALV